MEITFGSSAQRLLYGIFNGGRRHKAIRAFDDLSVIWKARAFRCQYIWNHLEIFLWIQEPSECPCLIHTRDFNEALSLYLADYRMAPCQPSTEGTIHLVNVRQEHCDCVRIYGGGGAQWLHRNTEWEAVRLRVSCVLSILSRVQPAAKALPSLYRIPLSSSQRVERTARTLKFTLDNMNTIQAERIWRAILPCCLQWQGTAFEDDTNCPKFLIWLPPNACEISVDLPGTWVFHDMALFYFSFLSLSPSFPQNCCVLGW